MLEPVLQAAWEGWLLVFSWPNILYPIAGTLLAMVFATIPGLTGAALMALAIPMTLHWDLLPTMLIFGAFVGGATFMGSVTAILFNIPGRASSAATLLDGHPLAQQGQASTAIGCAAAASALGSTFGVLVLVLLIPFMRAMLLAFGPAEFLMLALWGLTTLAVLSRESVLKGLAAAGLGLMLSFIGYDPRTAELRYTFGVSYLSDGMSLVPVFLGLFALSEVFALMRSGRTAVLAKPRSEMLGGSAWMGVLAVFSNFGLFLRSSAIGTIIGIIPGIGASVAGFVAYGHAAQWARRDRERFGSGDIRGVLAPEAANDAKDGGALVPTLAFGIPGGTATAVLLAALFAHGLGAGSEMLSSQLTLVFVLIWSLFLSNWLTSLLGLAAVRPMTHLAMLKTNVVIPIILMLATIGAYFSRGQMADVIAAYLFAVLGYAMRKNGWPRVPMVIALVLGPLFEQNLHLTLRLQALERIDFWQRPIPMVLLALCVVSLTLPAFQRLRAGRSTEARQ
ncbi:MAG TPA: tripartite tricarboxylate transporter permease [Gammaproteobacteria bacterium]